MEKLAATPFEAVTVIRIPGPYGRFLNLKAGIAMPPDPEFVVRLISDHKSHQAYLRQQASHEYKNLEHHLRGKHKLSARSRIELAQRLGVNMEWLAQLDGHAPDGALWPELLALFQLVEALPMQLASTPLHQQVDCPHCKTNILDDVDRWWPKNANQLSPIAYRFAERLLKALLGAGLIERVFRSDKHAQLSLTRLHALAHAAHHPIGNWLLEAQLALSCNSLAELEMKLELRGVSFSHARLKKWSSGQDVMPLKAAQAIVNACAQAGPDMLGVRAARTLALLSDFIAASVPQDSSLSSRHRIQEILSSRLAHLNNNMILGSKASEGKLTLRPAPPDAAVKG